MTAADDVTPASERTPLIASSTPSKSPDLDEDASDGSLHLTRARKNAILLILSAFILALGMGDELISPAQTRVLEAVVCRHYYALHDPSVILPGHDGWWDDQSRQGVLLGVQEQWCKVPQIQGQVAMVKGWQTGLDSIGSLLLAVPFGLFADRYGRKPLLIMLSISFSLRAVWQQVVLYRWDVFGVRAMWLSAIHSVLGGGVTVAAAVVFTAVADITVEAERTSAFFRVVAASTAATFISPPLSAWLMQRNPWIAMLLGVLIISLPIPFLGLVPETLHHRVASTSDSASTSTSSERAPPHRWQRVVKSVKTVVRDSVGFLAADLRLPFLVTAFMLHMLLVSGVRDTLLQYASTRYEISLSKSTLILAIRAGLNLVLMLLILPALSNWLNRRPSFLAHPSFADLLLARGSAVLMAAGFLAIALATDVQSYILGLVLNTAGWGLMTYLRSLALSFVDEHVSARLFAVMGLMDTAGLMVGAPALAKLFELGVSRGRVWMGLPFLACAAFTAVISIGLAVMRPGILTRDQKVDEDEPLLAGESPP